MARERLRSSITARSHRRASTTQLLRLREPARAAAHARSASSRATARSTVPSARRRCCAALADQQSRAAAGRGGRRTCSPRSSPPAGRSRRRCRSPSSDRAARSARRPRSSISAAQVRARACASIDEVFRAVEAGRSAIRRGAGGKFHRRRGRPHARSAAHHAAHDLRRGAAAVHQCLMSKVGVGGRDRSASMPMRRAWRSATNGSNQQPARTRERVPVVSNAEAARMAAQEQHAAAHRLAGGGRRCTTCKVLAAQHRGQPEQHHALPGASPVRMPRPRARDKTSLVMSARNRPGAMHDLLTPFAEHGVSMTRIESRPSRTGMWEYVFFVDIEGHQQDAARRARAGGVARARLVSQDPRFVSGRAK